LVSFLGVKVLKSSKKTAPEIFQNCLRLTEFIWQVSTVNASH